MMAAPDTLAGVPTLPPPGPERAGAAAPVLALDLGGTHLRTAVVDPDGRVHGRRMSSTEIALGADAVVDRCVASLRESLREYRANDGAPPVAVGVSAPGPLDPWRGMLIDPPNLGPTFQDMPLASRLSDALGIPCIVERDTQVAALAEGRFGAAVGLTDYLYLTVSTGVGGAVVTDGRLMRGPDGMAGELGHITVDMDGPTCGCGASGHLERFVSGTGLAASAMAALAAGRRSPFLEDVAARIAPAPLEGIHVAQAEEAGDPLAAEILGRARRAFAAAIVSFVDVFDPQRIVVGGGVAAGQGERLLGPAREAIARTAFRIPAARAEIVPVALGDDVGLIGTVPLVGMALARAA